MLQTIYPTTAEPSPCGPQCEKFGTAYHPDCVYDCKPVNSFLLSMGDIPHCRPQTNLDKLFPVAPSHYRKKLNLSTKEDCAKASKKIQMIKKKFKLTNEQIGDLFGVDQSTVNFLLHNRRKRMDVEKCRKIMAYEVKRRKTISATAAA